MPRSSLQKMRIYYTRSNSINPDPRVEKETAALVEAGHKLTILAWDRSGSRLKARGIFCTNHNKIPIVYCNARGTFGGGLANLPGLILFNMFLLKQLLINSVKYDAIHAADFDTIVPVLTAKLLLGKVVVYDIFDFYSDAFTVPKLIKGLIKRAELEAISFADHVILTNESRLEQIKGSRPKKITYIHNSPSTQQLLTRQSSLKACTKYELTLAYVGILQDSRLLLEILELFKKKTNWQLIVAGFGKYENAFREASLQFPNIDFEGKVTYGKALEISSIADILFATYDPSVPNHAYSSPNKLYEAMMLGKPIIVCENTGIDNFVIDNRLGFVCKYEIQSFEAALEAFMSNVRDKDLPKRASDLYKDFYSWDLMSVRLARIYESL
jgi:glycosyltransferase involved in cell wall biosynthesis